jgi:hypothetical protein
MGVRVSGGSVSILGFGIDWERTVGDERITRFVLGFLEDRRLLFGDRHIEHEAHCVASALECRAMLTSQLAEQNLGRQLEASLKAMRASFRMFVERGGPHGQHFQRHPSTYEVDRFSLALGDLRAQVGEQLARVAWRYDLEVDEELAAILPPDPDRDDVSWLPGFDDGNPFRG